MASEIPKKFKAVSLDGPGKPLTVREFDVPELKEGEILIKVQAAPLNPSDLSFVKGAYAINKPYPCVPGFEGAGVVVAGKGDKATGLIGKRVGFSAKQDSFTGSYGEYAVSTVLTALPVPEDVPSEVAASSFVNPYTVASMLETTKEAGVKAVVHTAAASQLGRMMVRYFQKNDVEVINVVRKPEQVEILKNIGAKHILNQNDADFSEQLEKLSKELEATYAFEAVSGDLTGKVLAAMPNGSTIFVYGALSQSPVQNIGVGDLIFKAKRIEGYWLGPKFRAFTPGKQMQIVQTIAQGLNTDFKSEVQKSFTYEQASDAVACYLQNMTGGKVILKP